MNIKQQIITGLNNLLSVFAKTYSDSQVKVSQKEVGGKVEMIEADGTLSPAPDGDYPMEDGSTLVVVGGVITEIKSEEKPAEIETETKSEDKEEEMVEEVIEEEAPVEEVIEEEAPVEEVIEEEAPVEESKVAELESKVSELEAKVDEMAKAMELMISEMMSKEVEKVKEETSMAIQEFNKQMLEINQNIKTLAKVPVQFSKTDNRPSVQDDKQEKMIALVNILNKK